MKQLITLLGVLCAFASEIHAQKLTFGYDQAGNQQRRTWICVNCRQASAAQPQVTEIVLETAMNSDSTKNFKRKIIASPNPTVETLNLYWETEKDVWVQNVKVYTVQGTRVHELNPLPDEKSVSMPFQHLPVGTYILDITFSDRRKETIKIIKQ